MRMKLKMSEKVHHEGASDRTGIFVQVEETMTNEFYIGFSCCQHPKNCSFCNCASLWPMWYIHRLRVNIYTHPRKNKMVKKKKKSWLRPEGKSFRACTTITLCCSRCLLGFSSVHNTANVGLYHPETSRHF